MDHEQASDTTPVLTWLFALDHCLAERSKVVSIVTGPEKKRLSLSCQPRSSPDDDLCPVASIKPL